MLNISDLKPTLKAQTDSVRTKLSFARLHMQTSFILVPLIYIHTGIKLSFLPNNGRNYTRDKLSDAEFIIEDLTF